MNDDLFLDSIKCAIVKAFFEPITFYENNNGYASSRSVGGYGAQVTELILKNIKLDQLAEEIAVEVMKRKDEVVKIVESGLRDLIFHKAYGDYKTRPEVEKAVARAVEICLSNDERFAEMLITRLNLKDAKFTITVKME